MNSVTALSLFVLDAIAVGAVGWIAARALTPRAGGLIEPGVAWLLVSIGWIVASGIALGLAGGLGAVGFATVHAAGAAILIGGRRRQVRDDAVAARAWLRSAGVVLWRTREGRAAVVLVFIWLLLGALALRAQPVVYDALAYRLPRIAGWLQEGRIGFFGVDDPRLDYMPLAPDLVMAWLLAPWSAGYLPAALAQWLGGGLALAATIGLARNTGLARLPAVGAAALLLGMANVAVQFTSAHTDLFTTGITAGAFYLGWRALARNEAGWLAGLGAGLALGSKGTVVYLAPAAVLWWVILARRYHTRPAVWLQTGLAVGAGIVVFAGPTFWSNFRHFGGPFGPDTHVRQHHEGGFLEKVGLNSWSSLIQSLDPQSQPWPFGAAASVAGARLAGTVPDDDRLTWGQVRRQSTLREIMARATPDADVVTFGVLPLLLFAGALVRAMRRDSPAAKCVLLWSAGVAAFLLFFHGMQRWHPFGFRYFTLAAPWLAVCGAWGLVMLPVRWRRGAWAVTLATGALVCWNMNARAMQAGWRAVVAPERYSPYHTMVEWREWARKLGPQSTTVTVALPENRPLAAFFRGASEQHVRLRSLSGERFETAAAATRAHGGWLVVPAATYLGREGAVAASVWLDQGDEANSFSLAAYRSLAPGELASTIVYRRRQEGHGAGTRWSFLVRPRHDGIVGLTIDNPAAEARAGRIITSAGSAPVAVGANASVMVSVPLPTGTVSEVRVEFETDRPAPAVTVTEPPVH